MKKIIITIFCLILSLSSFSESELSLPSNLKPFFVHKTINDAWGREIVNGFYCYEVDPGKGIVGPFVEIYVVQNGKVIEKISQGSSGRKLMEKIRKINLQPIDYQKEIYNTIDDLRSEYEKKGEKYIASHVLDGYMYEIKFELDDVKFNFKDANPGYKIYSLSEHNKNIRKLHNLYKEIMIYYAERKLHFK